MAKLNLSECGFGCKATAEGNIRIKHGKCNVACGRQQRGKKCLYRLDRERMDDYRYDDFSFPDGDGYCNNDASVKYSTEPESEPLINGASNRRCRLHYMKERAEALLEQDQYEVELYPVTFDNLESGTVCRYCVDDSAQDQPSPDGSCNTKASTKWTQEFEKEFGEFAPLCRLHFYMSVIDWFNDVNNIAFEDEEDEEPEPDPLDGLASCAAGCFERGASWQVSTENVYVASDPSDRRVREALDIEPEDDNYYTIPAGTPSCSGCLTIPQKPTDRPVAWFTNGCEQGRHVPTKGPGNKMLDGESIIYNYGQCMDSCWRCGRC